MLPKELKAQRHREGESSGSGGTRRPKKHLEAKARPYTKALTYYQSRRTRTFSSTTERLCVLCCLSFWS